MVWVTKYIPPEVLWQKCLKLSESVLLYIKQIVREDFIGLYGFLTKDEIEMFSLVISINGVGCKSWIITTFYL